MKRFLASALVLSSFSLVAFSGCEEKSKETTEVKKTTPDGTKDVKQTTEVKATGDEKSTAAPVEAPK